MAFRVGRAPSVRQYPPGQPTQQQIAHMRNQAASLTRPGDVIQRPQVVNQAKVAMMHPPPYAYFGPQDLNPRPSIPSQQRILYDAMHTQRAEKAPTLRGPSLAEAFRNIWRR